MEIKDIRLKNLQKILETGQITQTELALKCDVSPSLISQIMTKRRNMGSAFARKLEEKLKLSEGWFDLPHSLLDAPWHLRQRQASNTEHSDLNISKREMRLIELFRQMPESEKTNIISGLEIKRREYDKLLDELMAVKSDRFFNPDDQNGNENNE